MKRFVLILASVWVCSGAAIVAGEIGYIEQFALSQDRSEALKQLIPGTEDFYYYHCLHYQNTEQFDQVEKLLQAWIKRYNYTPRVREIQNRQALLTYRLHPQQSLEHIRRTLKLEFNHQRERVGARPDLPSQLDASLISRDKLVADAMRRYKNLDGFENSALDWLVATKLSPDRRRNLLQRLTRPDYPNLAQLVIDDLNYKGSRGFGSLPIHRQLLLSQLDECVRLKADLLNNTQFVNTYLSKLRPSDDVDLAHDPEARTAYYDRVWTFVRRLAPTHNSLKVHVLYHRLQFDREQGQYDKDRFMTYIRLPRATSYANPKYVQQLSMRRFAANLSADFRSLTLLPPVGNDEPLVRSYLQHFFLTETTYKPYESYLNSDYLKQTFAETKIVNGLGDAEQWSSLLPPEKYQALKERVDLDFAYTNKRYFAGGEPIRMDLFVKNVPTLIVKVYEINTYNYYRKNLKEVNTDINLDGLVANQEQTYRYQEPPLRRVARHFEFPKLADRGVYVIDFIGNGKSSRAVIRKGRLSYLARTSTAGHVVTVLNEQNEPVKGAALWLAGHEYQAGSDGTITVPFSTRPGRQRIVLSHGSFSTLDSFNHQAESYRLAAGIYVDRESLLARRKARVLIRPALYLNGTPTTLTVLEDVRLVIRSTDHDGVATSKEVPDFKLLEDRESVYEFQVPPRMIQLEFTLKAKVQSLSQNKKLDLAAGEQFRINGIDQTEKIEDLHLAEIGGQYVLELLGKTGESRAHRPVQLTVKHRDFRTPVTVTMQSNEDGQLLLGALTDVSQLTAQGPQETKRSWTLRADRHSYSATLQGQANAAVELPYMGAAKKPERSELSLLELRGTQFVADRFAALSLKNGMLRATKLPPGDYDLYFKRNGTRVRIKITAGKVREQYVLGRHRLLELRGQRPLQIDQLDVNEQAVVVHVANASKFSRVHIFATRYEPAFWTYDYLGRIIDREPAAIVLGIQDSLYAAGRKIGDEYRYILDRRYAKKYPGNMLERPSLLLNPWALRKTETGEQRAGAGEEFEAEPPAAETARSLARRGGEAAATTTGFSNLDFLAHGSVVMANLVPDKNGVITLDRKKLASHQRLWIVAVDPDDTACRSLSLPRAERDFVDTRLQRGLDPKQHFTQQKQISAVKKGTEFQLADVTTARFETYDSLAKVYSLLVTLSKNSTLVEFGFIVDWDRMKPEQKRAKYSKYACHELNFFLYHKDPAFFKAAVLPYLKNKKDKTFLDHWLVGDDLTAYLDPWKYAQLNVVERILLAQRAAADRKETTRLVHDLYDLLPPDTDRYNLLFDTAIKGRALDAENKLGQRVEELRRVARPQRGLAAAPPPAPAGFGGGGLGGRAANAARRKSLAVPQEGKPAAKAPAKGKVAELGKMVERLGEKKESLDLYYRQDRGRRRAVRRLYLAMDKTQEWAENNYYHLPIEQQKADLVTVNAFWRDYADHDPQQPFLSTNFAEASRNFPEAMLALAVLDLPARAGKHQTSFRDTGLTLTAANPLVLFHEEIKPAEPVAGKTPILVSQNFFRHGDRYQYINNQRVDKYVTDEFLVQTVYGCQVVVTNPTSAPQKLDLLLQIPQGAIPVMKGHVTRSVHTDLQPFHTTTVEYYFYFPFAGQFSHYPVHVAKNEKLLAFAPPVTLQAVDQLSKVDRDSWDYVSQFGTDQDVITFLQQKNLQRIKLDRIAFRMQDAKFFQTATRLLAHRHVYNHTLWSYSIKHDVPERIREYLEHADQFVAQCGAYLSSPLLVIDPVARKTYQHLDYRPLVNARAHQLGRQRQIVNERFLQQYQRLLKILSYERQLSDAQLMAVTYYLLLQDRIEEAQPFFQRVNPKKLATRLQYDYFTAYLDFFRDAPQQAGPIAARYAEYPVDRWRKAFEAIQQQLSEIAGQANRAVDPEDRDQSQTALAATEPSFDFTVEAKKIKLNYQNIKQVRVNYYLMDIEMLFSRNPFVQQYSGQFSTIRPNTSTALPLPPGKKSIAVDLPVALQNSNVLVEIQGAGQTRSQAYYANSLSVQVIENYGQLRVTNQATGQPLSKVYVKVYARMRDAGIRFYKDGYTDLRGRFDYSSLNTNDLDNVEKFSLLILSEQHGAVVREAAPPKR